MAKHRRASPTCSRTWASRLKLPQVDVAKIMGQHHQKNLDADGEVLQAVASGASEVASKQRAIEEAVKDVTEMAKEYKPGGSPQEIMAKQSEFAKKAMEAAIANTAPTSPSWFRSRAATPSRSSRTA